MALFSTAELFGDVLISWMPFYFESKIIFIVWLSLPGTRGADKLYDKVIEPYLHHYEEHIDAHTEIVSQHISASVKNVRAASLGFIKSKSVEILSSTTQLIANASASSTESPKVPTPLSAFRTDAQHESGTIPTLPLPASSSSSDSFANEGIRRRQGNNNLTLNSSRIEEVLDEDNSEGSGEIKRTSSRSKKHK